MTPLKKTQIRTINTRQRQYRFKYLPIINDVNDEHMNVCICGICGINNKGKISGSGNVHCAQSHFDNNNL